MAGRPTIDRTADSSVAAYGMVVEEGTDFEGYGGQAHLERLSARVSCGDVPFQLRQK